MEYPRSKKFIEIVLHFLELPVATQKRFLWRMKKFLKVYNFFIYHQLNPLITNDHQYKVYYWLNGRRTAERMQKKTEKMKQNPTITII